MATSYEAFSPWVLINCPGAPEIAVVQALRDAAVQFCELSLIHQVDHDPVSAIANLPDYDLESPVSGTRVFKIMKAWFQKSPLTPIAPDQVNDPTVYNQNIGGVDLAPGTPQVFIHKDDTTFSLLPIPKESVSNAITLRVALAPLRSSSTCADFLYEKWGEEIAAGALMRLTAQINRPYTNPSAAAMHQARFMIGVNKARQQANHGYNRSNLQVRLRSI